MDAHRFWRLLWQLPFYDGAVKVTLRQWYEQNTLPDEVEEAERPKTAYDAPLDLPIPEHLRNEPYREVPLEAFNFITGLNMISFGNADGGESSD